MADDRQSCACPCDCDAKTEHPSAICWTCRDGAHRPSRAVRAHLAAGVVEWLRLQPGTGGSSGMSPKQVAHVREAWNAWHASKPCPVGR